MYVPVPQITDELMEIAEQLVVVPMPQILGKSWQACRSCHREHADVPVLLRKLLR